jgi:superfamily II DNA/RNA helicase
MQALRLSRGIRQSRAGNAALAAHESNPLHVVISAATLPTDGEKGVDANVRAQFPTAIHIQSPYMHKHHPQISQRFLQCRMPGVGVGQRSDVLPVPDELATMIVDLLRSTEEMWNEEGTSKGTGRGKGGEGSLLRVSKREQEIGSSLTSTPAQSQPSLPRYSPTMIFVNTAQDAQRLHTLLLAKLVPCTEFHKNMSYADRMHSLRSFQSRETSVLVCTDHAARGLDLPLVRHVIQAQFATNVVQYLHRIGRCSRAGRSGLATSFVTSESSELVSIIQRSQAFAVAAPATFAAQAVPAVPAVPAAPASVPTPSYQRREQRGVEGQGQGRGQDEPELLSAFSRKRGLRRRVKKNDARLQRLQEAPPFGAGAGAGSR